ncbi:hypothetical protein [Aurantimicrobium minutum]|uniref:hypothetical protein n=1 Tax=Aurantimicrobium minutum TaxID=708131 RepID=UPI002476E681|nr:hypothetical protein [Aurantimicrobium minutum]MDH6423410.1 hypothetical protein [Aurantimicrobium minutum]
MHDDNDEVELDDDALALAAGGVAPSKGGAKPVLDPSQIADPVVTVSVTTVISNFSDHYLDHV